jgi:serine protease SohB
MEKVATGEHWLGERAHSLGLVDALQTSDDYLMAQRDTANILHLRYIGQQTLIDKISSRVSLLNARFVKNAQEESYPKFM